MGVFDSSDKKNRSSDWLDLTDLAMVDLSKELNTALSPQDMVFGKFAKSEIIGIMRESNLLPMIEARGYHDTKIEINVLSDLDNRIFVKTQADEVLVHMRLKFSDFAMGRDMLEYKMVYIDWLLTQNVRLRPGTYKKNLFFGQEYPGLAIFVEITEFIRLLTKKLGAHGVFNIPEYFHDAVLFRNNFRYLDPRREGEFRALLDLSPKIRIRDLSNAIHNRQLVWKETGLEFQWFHGEMLTTIDPMLEAKVFHESYFKQVEEVREKAKFEWKGLYE